MGDLTKNISRHELACKCGCGYDSMDVETIAVLQDCCNHFAAVLGLPKVSVNITSACRCADHNAHVGGTLNSQHLKARAIDFIIYGVNPHDAYDYLAEKYPNQYGLGRYPNFTHLDTRTDGPARW